MNRFLSYFAAALVALIAIVSVNLQTNAAEKIIVPVTLTSLMADIPTVVSTRKIPNMSTPRRYAAACGLCTTESCCGGTENGWRLCKSNCKSGTYKCVQVSTCP